MNARASSAASSTIALHEIVPGLSRAMDLVSPEVVSHHARTAYFSNRLCEAAGLPVRSRYETVVAALLHDAGAFSRRERLDLLQFELLDTGHHCIAGWRLLEHCEPLRSVARLIRGHHARWDEGGEPLRECHIIHLADRAEILTPRKGDALPKVRGIVRRLSAESGKLFDPELVRLFAELAANEGFWLDAALFRPETVLAEMAGRARLTIDTAALDQLARVFGFLIDFKSRYTATPLVWVAV
jgi:response regulator RpfG family c-di-GMP phosphodiesterase